MNESLPRGLTGARQLLGRAREMYDGPDRRLCEASRAAWRGGFASGGRWMQLVLLQIRGCDTAVSRDAPAERSANASRLTWLGVIKYGLASAAALPWLALAFFTAQPFFTLLCVPAFYAVEAQMVFLFPLVLDGCDHPYSESRRWTSRAGGTLTVMSVVLPIAVTMLLGGFVGRGLVRSWCLGCLAVCLWYQDLRRCQRSVRSTHAA